MEKILEIIIVIEYNRNKGNADREKLILKMNWNTMKNI